MQLSFFTENQNTEVIQLFSDVFTAAENEQEGKLIGELVTNMITTTPNDELIGFVAKLETKIAGAIFFSKFTLANQQRAFILSPVAVATELQGTGIGQQLISFGLEHLKTLGVEVAITYGDPAYYSKLGFQPISEALIQAPFPLSQPIGWLAQSLTAEPLKTINGPTTCIAALSDAKYW